MYNLPKAYNNLYLTRYIKLIETRKYRIIPDNTYTETHHILPRSFKGSNSNENLIILTAREHYIAHWMLWLAYKNPQMTGAFMMMHSFNYKQKREYNSRRYELLKKDYSELKKITMLGEGNPFYGKKHTDEARQYLSDIKTGINVSWNTGLTKDTSEKLIEVGKNISKSVKGMRHWTNGIDEIKAFACPADGWYIGRLENENYKYSEERKNKMKEDYSGGKMNWWNNGVINKRNYEPPNDGGVWVSGRLLKDDSKFLNNKDYLRKYDYAIIQDIITGDVIKVSYINKEYESYGKGFRQNIGSKGKYKNYKLIEFILNKNTKRK